MAQVDHIVLVLVVVLVLERVWVSFCPRRCLVIKGGATARTNHTRAFDRGRGRRRVRERLQARCESLFPAPSLKLLDVLALFRSFS